MNEEKSRKGSYKEKDLVSSLREMYGDKLDDIEGCLGILEDISKNNGDVFKNRHFFIADERFHELMSDAEEVGFDVKRYFERYSKLVDEIDKKYETVIVKARDAFPRAAFHRGESRTKKEKFVKLPLRCHFDLEFFERESYDKFFEEEG